MPEGGGLRVTMCPSLLKTAMAYACCRGLFVNNMFFCFHGVLDWTIGKSHSHPGKECHFRLTVPNALVLGCA